MRRYSAIDHLFFHVDRMVRTVWGRPPGTRDCPGNDDKGQGMPADKRALSAQLMRINHTGEVCAQALYQGQALTARTDALRGNLERAAEEENDHLNWTSSRLQELGQAPSRLNPAFYLGSLFIGMANGMVGDRWNLGFLAETERQVVRHLDNHLAQLPENDDKSRAILEQMKVDEQHHATGAMDAGGMSLPAPVRGVMTVMSKIMTTTTRWI